MKLTCEKCKAPADRFVVRRKDDPKAWSLSLNLASRQDYLPPRKVVLDHIGLCQVCGGRA